MSIVKAQPLKIDRNKELTVTLHKRDHQTNSGRGHKPEIVVALFRFETFASFQQRSKFKPLFGLTALQRFVVREDYTRSYP